MNQTSSWPAFKEWKLVCDALERGLQSLILRKGGIAEGRGGFSWKSDEFFLFPTYFHEQADKLRLPWKPEPHELRPADESKIEIRLWGRLIQSWELTDFAITGKLRSFHIWSDEVVEERFRYGDQPGLHVALVRVYRLPTVWVLKNEKRFGGCRSWLDFPEPVELPPDWKTLSKPAIGEAEFQKLQRGLENLLG